MKYDKQNINFRFAGIDDSDLILDFIRDLAEYEQLASEVVATKESLQSSLFGEKAYAEVVFATVDNVETGFVLFYHNYSTFLGKPGIYIEDLFVKEEYRGMGIGKSILEYISGLALERDCGRVEWWVLNWNPARKFYESIKARAMDEWVVYRLDGADLVSLAEGQN